MSKRPSNSAAKEARRRVADGYPRDEKFRNRKELEEYFQGDLITCLLCGRRMRRISGSHLLLLHDMTQDEYKLRYDIPLSWGLGSSELSEIRRDIALKPANIERLARNRQSPAWAERQMASEKSGRPPPSWLISELASSNRGRDRYTRPDYEQILDRVLAGMLISEACKSKGSPSQAQLARYLKKNPDFADVFNAAIDAMPYDAQCRINRLGARFKKEVLDRIRAGHRASVIAAELRVTETTVYKLLRSVSERLRKEGPTIDRHMILEANDTNSERDLGTSNN